MRDEAHYFMPTSDVVFSCYSSLVEIQATLYVAKDPSSLIQLQKDVKTCKCVSLVMRASIRNSLRKRSFGNICTLQLTVIPADASPLAARSEFYQSSFTQFVCEVICACVSLPTQCPDY